MTEPLAGLAFPFRIVGGRVAVTRGFAKVREDVRVLLSTRLGERTMLRDYGGGLQHHLEAPNDTTLAALVRHEIESALRLHFPDVRLAGPVTVDPRNAEVHVTLDYRADPQAIARRFDVVLPNAGASR